MPEGDGLPQGMLSRQRESRRLNAFDLPRGCGGLAAFPCHLSSCEFPNLFIIFRLLTVAGLSPHRLPFLHMGSALPPTNSHGQAREADRQFPMPSHQYVMWSTVAALGSFCWDMLIAIL